MITKEQAEYVQPSKSSRICMFCSMYRLGKCTLVEGHISALGVCKHWESALKIKGQPGEGATS